jgi:hypothetical protein
VSLEPAQGRAVVFLAQRLSSSLRARSEFRSARSAVDSSSRLWCVPQCAQRAALPLLSDARPQNGGARLTGLASGRKTLGIRPRRDRSPDSSLPRRRRKDAPTRRQLPTKKKGALANHGRNAPVRVIYEKVTKRRRQPSTSDIRKGGRLH